MSAHAAMPVSGMCAFHGRMNLTTAAEVAVHGGDGEWPSKGLQL